MATEVSLGEGSGNVFRFQGLKWELRAGFAEKAELRKDEVCGTRGALWEPAVSGTQGMSMGRYPGDQGLREEARAGIE